jgi:SAM-dependent methyltransferase
VEAAVIKVPPHPVRDVLTRALFDGSSLAGRVGQTVVCALYFAYKHREVDPWAYATSPYEQRKYARLLALADGRPYARALDVGCSEGVFTRLLAERAHVGEVVGVDISGVAIRRARERCRDLPHVRFERRNVFHAPPAGAFDLIVCAEMLYYAGLRATAVARRLAGALAPGGRIVLAHPTPRAAALHAPFHAIPGLVLRAEAEEDDPVRPYALAAFEREPDGASGS